MARTRSEDATQRSEGLRERKKRQTREAIVAAAHDLFARNGYHETTLAEIAAVARQPLRRPPRRADARRHPGDGAHAEAGRHAPGMIRTCDLCLRRAALYPLSYGREGGVSVAGRGGRPR